MNLQQSIKRILKEETHSRMTKLIQDSINKVGLSTTIMIFGGPKTFISYVTDLNLTNKDKIEYIKNKLNNVGAITFSEFDLDPIFYSEDDEGYKEIVYLSTSGVIVDVWGKDEDYQTNTDTFSVYYNDLNDDLIDEIFHTILKIDVENAWELT